MRKILLASASVVALNCGAFAADLPSRVQAPVFVAAPPAFTWTGFYIGGIAGANFSDQRTSTSQGSCDYDVCAPGYAGDGYLGIGSTGGQSISGLLGGTIGYNYEFPSHVVLGIEGDGAAVLGGKHGHSAFGMSGYANEFNYGSAYGELSNRSQLNSIGTVRARLGYDFGRTLLFITGGLAIGNVKTSTYGAANYTQTCTEYPYSSTCTGSWNGSKSQTRTGFAVGGGLEHALTEHLTIKADALYYNLGTVKTNAKGSGYSSSQCCGCSCGSGPASAQPYTAKQKVDGVMARVGLNYKF